MSSLPLRPQLPLPQGVSERELLAFVKSICVADAPPAEMLSYGTTDFRRFVYTLGLAAGRTGRCLELGANPYFMTLLLKRFTPLDLTLANFFVEGLPATGIQHVRVTDLRARDEDLVNLPFDHFNTERDVFPYPKESFDLVLFCEIIEHLTTDPLHALSEIRRVLKPGGELILSTPNVARIENVARLIVGENVYDPYSGYGSYGRHNREYNKHELHLLLTFAGLVPEVMFSADVHDNGAFRLVDEHRLEPLVRFRRDDLGQYIFVRARNTTNDFPARKPKFLYRSYPQDELAD